MAKYVSICIMLEMINIIKKRRVYMKRILHIVHAITKGGG